MAALPDGWPKANGDLGRVDQFTRRLDEAAGRVATRAECLQLIVEEAAECLGAMTAAFFQPSQGGSLRRVAVAGLFPPLYSFDAAISQGFSTRTRFIEHVLRTEEVLIGENLAARVAATGRGAFIADAKVDPRVVQHPDPALAVQTIIFVPLALRDGGLGVLALVNAVSGRSFTVEDLAVAESIAAAATLALGDLN